MKVGRLQEEKPDIATKSGFNALYEGYASKAFGFLLHHLQNEKEAEDLLQDVFADLWHKRHRIEVKGQMENFLITACKYKLIDHFRKNKNRSILEVDPAPQKWAVPTPEDMMLLSELKSRLFASFKKLPARTKEVFLLSRKEGLTNKEIAKNLFVSEKTVEYHIGKTLKQLKTYFFLLF